MTVLSRLRCLFRLVRPDNAFSPICRGLLVFGSAMHLLGCTDQDRILTAHCEVESDSFAAATFESSDASGTTFGSLNARQDALGTLFQLAPGGPDFDGAHWIPVHTVTTQAVKLSHEYYWNSGPVRMRVKLDVDGDELADSARSLVASTLLSGSGVVVFDAEREAVENVLQVVNADERALRLLQEAAPEHRHLVVSSRFLGRYVDLFYSPGGGVWLPDGTGSASTPFITPWTFRIGNTNFHSTFSCPPAVELNAKAASLNARVPSLYLYTPIRYDPASGMAVRDARVAQNDLLTSSFRSVQ